MTTRASLRVRTDRAGGAHLACERHDARLCQLWCLDYWAVARIAPWSFTERKHTDMYDVSRILAALANDEVYLDILGLFAERAWNEPWGLSP
jgi:hypothetical protein